MRSGSLDTQITIQVLSAPTQDEYGQPVESWSDEATVWADVRDSRSGGGPSGEQFSEGERQAWAVKTFHLRYRASIAPKSRRISYSGMTWDILHVHHDRRDGTSIVTARARAD